MGLQAVAVIGAGPLGMQFALHCARAGYRTILEDILPASLRRAADQLAAAVAAEVVRGELTAAAGEQIRGRVEFATSVEEAARQADLVIEAVPDESESKLEIIVFLDKLCRPGTILATTATCLTVADMAGMTFRATHVVGLLGRYSPSGQFEVELVAGPDTAAETMASLVPLAEVRN